tara:strand:+ start:29351 stop:31456 length:2106 start_codon:yes stop_codon:yes gene_type:complete
MAIDLKDDVRTGKLSDEEKLAKFKEDITTDAENVDDQREKANEDMRFKNVDGGQWEGFYNEEFADRARLEFDVVSNYVNRFIGEWNLNRVGVDFKPDDTATSDDDAELLNGIYRADFQQFSGGISTDNAVDEAATCGVGAFKLGTLFEDEGDEENDLQRIEWRPIYNAYWSVFWDISAMRIDKRDARWCTELKEFTRSSFLAKYPDEDPVSAYEPDTLESQNINEFRIEKVYIATRYEVVKKKTTIYVYNNMQTGEQERFDEEDHVEIETELKADKLRKFVRKRKVITQHIDKTVFSGAKILEETRRIAGKWIPIIPVYAYRAYVDGLERYSGLIRKLKDPQRLMNMQISQLAENAASAGQEVPIFDPDQMQGGIGDLWADRNNKPYMLARALRNDDGTVIQAGPLGYLKPPQLDGSTTALMQIVPNHIQGVTGGAPQETLNPDASGKAINALAKRENLNTQSINDNIRNAIKWSGEVYQSIAAEVYDSQRTMNLVGKDGTESQTLLFKTVIDEETGRMIEGNNLRGKRFRVISDAGPAYDSLREQTVEELKGMLDTLIKIPQAAEYIPVILAVILENTAGVGLDPIRDLNRKNMVAMGLKKPETDEEKQAAAAAQQPKGPDPQEELVKAAAAQQQAEARNLDSKSLANAADAEKKAAETRQTEVETAISIQEAGLKQKEAQVNTLLSIRDRVMNTAQQGL